MKVFRYGVNQHSSSLSTSFDPARSDRDSLSPAVENSFLHPEGTNREHIRQQLIEVVEQITTTLSAARQLPPVPLEWPQIDPAHLIPEKPVDGNTLLEASQQLLIGSMNPAHPRYLGHMDPLPSVGSVIGSMITAAVNNNLLSREMSPIFSELEQNLCRELAQLFGLPATAAGMLQSGGTLCNLQALTVARNKHFPVQKQGLAALKKPPVLFASELCHSSIQKAAMILGLGTDAVIPVRTNADCQMEPDALQQAVRDAIRNNQQPFAVVATAGTTVTGNIDPLPEIATICQQENLWFHVDASYGGAIIFSEKQRPKLTGTALADSITFNPQKWCYVTKACALVLFRDEKVLRDHFQIAAPYMSLNETAEEPQLNDINLGEWGVQGTRAPEIAKWWLTLLQLGRSGLSELVDRSCQLTRIMHSLIEERDYLELAAQPQTNLLCFRDTRGSSSQMAQTNTALQAALLKEADAFLSLPRFRNSRWLKAVLLNPFTTEADLREIFGFIDLHNPA